MICCKYLHGKWKSDDDATFAHLIHHDSDVMMGAMASQITSLFIVYSTVYSGSDQRKHQSSASLAIVRGIHRWPVNSPHKRPVTRKMFPFDDVIMMNVAVNMIISGPCNGLASDRPLYSQLTDLMSMEPLGTTFKSNMNKDFKKWYFSRKCIWQYHPLKVDHFSKPRCVESYLLAALLQIPESSTCPL